MSDYSPTDAELDYLVREYRIPREEAMTLYSSMKAEYDKDV